MARTRARGLSKKGGGAPNKKHFWVGSTAGEVQEGLKKISDKPSRRDRTNLSAGVRGGGEVRGAGCVVRGAGYGARSGVWAYRVRVRARVLANCEGQRTGRGPGVGVQVYGLCECKCKCWC